MTSPCSQSIRSDYHPVDYRDAYLSGKRAVLRNALAGLESVTAFHTVFLVADSTGVVLQFENNAWLEQGR
jgi:hypothetical protein